MVTLKDQVERCLLLNSEISILEDESRTFTLDSILKYSQNFHPVNKKQGANLIDNWNAVYWVKIDLVLSQHNNLRKWVLELKDFNIPAVEIYRKGPNQRFLISKAGAQINYGLRDYNSQSLVFDIYPDTISQSIYFKFQTDFATNFYCVIKTQQAFTADVESEHIIQGVCIGIIVIMVVYCLILFVSTKEYLYLYYLFFMMAALFKLSVINHWGFQYLWPENSQLNPKFTMFSEVVFTFSLTLNANAYLNNKKNLPFFYYLLLVYSGGLTAYWLLNYIIRGDYWIFSFGFHFLIYLLIFLNTIWATIKNVPYAKYFLPGVSLFLLDWAWFYLSMVEIMSPPLNFKGFDFSLTIISEACFFSFALSKKIKAERKKQEEALIQSKNVLKENNHLLFKNNLNQAEIIELNTKVNKELEEKVKQRTAELANKNEEIKGLYDYMTEWNIKLDKQNWDLNKDIKELHKQKVLGIQSDEEFNEAFPNDYSCMQLINELKWANGFICIKCKTEKWTKGPSLFSRVCTKCHYNESLFKDTLHEGSKFPIHKAFFIMFKVYSTQGKISASELAFKLQLGEQTCGLYKKKILEKMNKKGKFKPNGWQELILK